MDLGAFSLSLAVKDLAASRAFYEKLGFRMFGGSPDEHWVMLRNGDHVIGLFQGMFEGNILTFNPGWDQNAAPLANFSDVREIQRTLRERGVEITSGVEDASSGPGSIVLTDPDGNTILIDQHVG